jgi:hypothetical protein
MVSGNPSSARTRASRRHDWMTSMRDSMPSPFLSISANACQTKLMKDQR